jgi:hypothetical protein
VHDWLQEHRTGQFDGDSLHAVQSSRSWCPRALDSALSRFAGEARGAG